MGVDTRYELFLYDPGMNYLDSLILAHRESKPDWVEGRSAGIERTLSAEFSWQQGEMHILQFDRREITFLDECGEDGLPVQNDLQRRVDHRNIGTLSQNKARNGNRRRVSADTSRQPHKNQIDYRFLKGALFATFVAAAFVKGTFNMGERFSLDFRRDNHRKEIDGILESGTMRSPARDDSPDTYLVYAGPIQNAV